jgi:hypothetical protein
VPSTGQLVAAIERILRLNHASGLLRVDAQAQRRAPQKVGDEAHRLPIVGEDPRARPFEALLRHQRPIDRHVELGLRHAVGPHDPRHVDSGCRAQPEVDHGVGNRLLLPDEPGSDLDVAPEAEGVDPLVAGVLLGLHANRLPG